VISRRAQGLGVFGVVVSDAVTAGGQGAVPLAECVIRACKENSNFRFLYPLDIPLKDKIRRIAKTIYGAKEVTFSEEANKKVLALKKAKLDNLPICMAKTQLSISHNPKRKGRPHGFKFPIEDIEIHNGAGCITAYSDNIKMMPGLSKVPRGTRIDIDEEGNAVGLF